MTSCSNSESGKIFVKGKASGKYACDKVRITITFRGRGISGAETSETVTKQCEQFLQKAAQSGMDLSKIRLENDKITQPAYHDEEQAAASRTIEFDSDAGTAVIGCVLEVIQQEHLDVDLSTEYYLSGEDELRKSLRENAVADSRANAELLARAAGRTITGVDMIDLSERHPRPMRSSRDLSEQEFQQLSRYMATHSRKLSMPEKELEEEVEVTWLIG